MAHMPPSAQAPRLTDDAVMGFGAYRHSRTLLLLGAALIAASPIRHGRDRPGATQHRKPLAAQHVAQNTYFGPSGHHPSYDHPQGPIGGSRLQLR